jgi:hypothetical protein
MGSKNKNNNTYLRGLEFCYALCYIVHIRYTQFEFKLTEYKFSSQKEVVNGDIIGTETV